MRKQAIGTCVCAAIVALIAGFAYAQDGPEITPIPDVEYQLAWEAGTVEVWIRSYAEHGIACAYVDLYVSMPITEIAYGDEYTLFHLEGPANRGVTNLGGCSLVPGGTGQGDWSLVATATVDVTNARRLGALLAEPSHPQLGTSVYGEGYAMGVDYGDPLRVRLDKPSRRVRKAGVR